MTSASAQRRARDTTDGRAVPNQPQVKEAVLGYLREGMSYERAADLSGIERTTLWDWRKKDRAFSAECRRAVSEWARQEFNAVDDPKWRLERRLPAEFSARSEIRQFTSEDPDDRDDELSDEELEKAAR